jgi:DNA-binding MarR family transcriptional regulator
MNRDLAALELAGIRHRRTVRKALRIGEEDLAALLFLTQHGPATQGRLASATALSRSGAGALVTRLEDRGYVARATDPGDRRLRVVSLTPAARALLDEAYAGIAARDDDLRRLLAAIPDTNAPTEQEPKAAEPIWRHWA